MLFIFVYICSIKILNIKPSTEFPVRYGSADQMTSEPIGILTPLCTNHDGSSPIISDNKSAPVVDEDDGLVVVYNTPTSPDSISLDFEHDAEMVEKPPVTPDETEGVILGCELGNILSMADMNVLYQALPVTLQDHKWLRLYSLLDDGAAFDIFYNKTSCQENTLLAVETDTGEVFGGFASCPWHRTFAFYGGGESFVFRVGKLLYSTAIIISTLLLLLLLILSYTDMLMSLLSLK